MRRLLLILILTLSFQNLSKADDIRDFQIEGIGVGDSLLDFVSKSEIEKNKDFKYPNKKYFDYLYLDKKDSIYDYFQFSIKDGDKNYIIEDLTVGIYFKNNIKGCLKKMDEIFNDVSKIFSNLETSEKNRQRKHRADPSGKTIITETYFYFTSGALIALQCHDYSKAMKYNDGLSIEIASSSFYDWISSEAYN
jgi:hypothetical protein